MIDTLHTFTLSGHEAFVVYLIAGLFFMFGNTRIRWYCFSFTWIAISPMVMPFFAETCVLVVAFLLAEDFFKMYRVQLKSASKNSLE